MGLQSETAAVVSIIEAALAADLLVSTQITLHIYEGNFQNPLFGAQ